MSTLDQQDIFGSGPHAIRAGSWHRCLVRRGFAGIDGELVLDMGKRSRSLSQDGRLQAPTSEMLNTLISQIEQFIDGQVHVLVDNHGRTYQRVLLDHFEPTTPTRLGRSFWCEYTVGYTQLP